MKSTPLAVVIAVILAAAGIFLGQVRHTHALYADAMSAQAAVAAELQERAGQAHNLVTVAGRYISADDPDAAALAAAANALTKWRTMNDARALDQALDERASALEKKINSLTLSERDAGYVSNIKNEMASSSRRIAQGGYNDRAKAYNQSRLWRKPLALFE